MASSEAPEIEPTGTPAGAAQAAAWQAEAVTGEHRIADKITDKAVCGQLQRAVRMAGHGQTVWLVGRDGERIAALVSLERANASLLVPVDEAENDW